jgi:hypothetical protein
VGPRPLLGSEVEGRLSMLNGNDQAASWKHVGRVARIARRGVDADRVLDVHVGRTELGQVAEAAVALGHACILTALSRVTGAVVFESKSDKRSIAGHGLDFSRPRSRASSFRSSAHTHSGHSSGAVCPHQPRTPAMQPVSSPPARLSKSSSRQTNHPYRKPSICRVRPSGSFTRTSWAYRRSGIQPSTRIM